MSQILHFANAVRPPAFFSEAITPTRAMVVDHFGNALGLGLIVARHTILGKVTGYVVKFDDGERLAVSLSQVHSPDNIAAPPLSTWLQRRAAAPAPHSDPPSAA